MIVDGFVEIPGFVQLFWADYRALGHLAPIHLFFQQIIILSCRICFVSQGLTTFVSFESWWLRSEWGTLLQETVVTGEQRPSMEWISWKLDHLDSPFVHVNHLFSPSFRCKRSQSRLSMLSAEWLFQYTQDLTRLKPGAVFRNVNTKFSESKCERVNFWARNSFITRAWSHVRLVMILDFVTIKRTLK